MGEDRLVEVNIMIKKQIGTQKERLLEEKLDEAKFQENYTELQMIPLRLLSQLEDVSISSLANGHILTYNSTTKKWENGAP